MTIGQWLRQAQDDLKAADIDSARLDALMILEEAAGPAADGIPPSSASPARRREPSSGVTRSDDRAYILSHPETKLTPAQQNQADGWLKRRLKHEPLAHIFGRREFYGLELDISPDVLVPRVETEKIAEWAIEHPPRGSHLLDMGTGSGALAIAIKQHRPDLRITASDISSLALDIAARNAKRYKLSIDFVQSDLWEAIPGRFASIVTNLPYLSDDAMGQLMTDAKHEPAVALYGGTDGLGIYRRFLAGLPEHLEPTGLLFTECDPWQQPDLIDEAQKVGLSPFAEDYFVLGFKREGPEQ